MQTSHEGQMYKHFTEKIIVLRNVAAYVALMSSELEGWSSWTV